MDLIQGDRVTKYKEPTDGTQGARILRFLRSLNESEPGAGATDEEMATVCEIGESSVRPRRAELHAASLIKRDFSQVRTTPGGGECAVWVALTPEEIAQDKERENARSARPVETNVVASNTLAEGKQVALALAHCGEFLVKEKEIVGWVQPIPMKLWARIVGFHRTVSKAMNSESVSYHRFNPKTGFYDTIIPHQITQKNGLHVHTPWDQEKNRILLDRYAQKHGAEFFPANTIHTHVNAGAFESGTDAGDEKDLPGWHITLGHLNTFKDMDVHCRFRLPQIPKVKKLTFTERGYVIDAKHLFARGTKPEQITRQDESDPTWHKFIERVSYH